MNAADPFWLVWNPRGRAPTVRHPSLHSATSEAERLARLDEGEEFIVLQAVAGRQVTTMQRTEYALEIPF